MKKLIGLLSLLNVAYCVEEYQVTEAKGSFEFCTDHMLNLRGEVMIWNEMRGYDHSLTNGSTNTVFFTWQLPQEAKEQVSNHLGSIKVKFKYRMNNLSPDLKNQVMYFYVHDNKAAQFSCKKVDTSNEIFVEDEIEIEDKEAFLETIDENNQCTLGFSTNGFAYKIPDANEWGGLSIRASNKNKSLCPILILE